MLVMSWPFRPLLVKQLLEITRDLLNHQWPCSFLLQVLIVDGYVDPLILCCGHVFLLFLFLTGNRKHLHQFRHAMCAVLVNKDKNQTKMINLANLNTLFKHEHPIVWLYLKMRFHNFIFPLLSSIHYKLIVSWCRVNIFYLNFCYLETKCGCLLNWLTTRKETAVVNNSMTDCFYQSTSHSISSNW